MKVVVNRDYGGCQLSEKAYEFLGLEWDGYGFAWANSKLVECVETLDRDASGSVACLVVVEIPDDVEYWISDYDGIETIHEGHRSWWYKRREN